MSDWDPTRYGAFRDLRLRPALDLLAQVPELPAGDVVDLGCGDGAVAAALAGRYQGVKLVGVDSSATMLEAARGLGHYASLEQADISRWVAASPPALIFSNAALNWVPDHEKLLLRLVSMLTPGGVLAVQMPRQGDAPSHRLLREVAERLYSARFPVQRTPVLQAAEYAGMLLQLGDVRAWTTEYVQLLDPVPQGHPVRAFTESTAMRPFVQGMTDGEARAYVAEYDSTLAKVYPALPDGRVLFPFTRVFFILERT